MDVDAISSSYVYAEKLKTNILQLICSCLCCKGWKDRSAKHKARALDYFQSSHDIQNMFSNYVNLNLLTRVMMAKE